jgi:hypothetical protein
LVNAEISCYISVKGHNKMRKDRLLFITIFILISFFFGFDFKCDDEEKDEIKVYITCSGSSLINNSFSGIYLYNSNPAVNIVPIKDSNSLYTYTAIFDDLDSVVFQVTRADVNNTLTIWIYRDGTMLTDLTKSLTPSDTTTYILDFSYNY